MIGNVFMDNLWLAVVMPFIGFILIGVFYRARWHKLSALTAIAAVGVSTVIGWASAINYFFGGYLGQTMELKKFQWLQFSANLAASFGVLVDDISMVLVVVVTTISLSVHIYSVAYMGGDPGFRRYFAFLNLFTFSMLGLVVSVSIVQIFVFWELVGLSSFLLIGFYYSKPSAVAACKKAFIVTRFADFGFLIGLFLLGYFACGFDFIYLTSNDTIQKLASQHVPIIGVDILTLSALLIFAGAAGKSAMFPLHVWLPDAMEGPTPVSALIHAATMVVAGVYLVARMFPLYCHSEFALNTVMCIGAFTSLFAAIIALTQFDIKRVLAYSTLSQIGYMMLALGVASEENTSGFSASIFHLTTHACFKALLFLGAGSVIHALETNDLRKMGGLAGYMPWTHWTFLIACLTIAGVPPLSGFFSKDAILMAAFGSGHYLVFGVALATAGLTAFYMFRIYFMAFQGNLNNESAHPHESPILMRLVLVVLAILSSISGFLPFQRLVHRGEIFHEHGLLIPVVSVLVSGCGIITAWVFYGLGLPIADRFAYAFGPIYKWAFNKFYIDDLYYIVTHKIIFRYICSPFNWFDRNCVDGLMDLIAKAILLSGEWTRKTVVGKISVYLLWSVLGVILIILGLVSWSYLGLSIEKGLTAIAVVALVFVFVWQLILNLLNRSEPLKKIDRD